MREKFDEKQYKHLELAGFYWIAEQAAHTATILNDISEYLNGYKYSLNWIPYYGAQGYNYWKTYGFNYAYYQPNYFFNESTPYSQLETACRQAELYNMDMELDVNLTAQNCYLSIADMKAYNAAQAAEHPERIDLVYFFRNGNLDTAAINHSFVAPACKKYIPQNLTLPAGVENDTKIRDVGIKDAHLARLHLKNPPEAQPGIYIDDIDLQTIDLSNMPNWAFDLIANDGMWVATEDGKYHAYIYINSANRGRAGATISMKRYTMY